VAAVEERGMMRVLLADDEAPARRRIMRLLAGVSGVEVVGEASSGTAAVDAIRTLKPDVVFLDIQMPEGTGFDVVAAIGVEQMPHTVFVTAFDEHAIRAFEVAAVDYILKPFTPERLQATIERLRQRLDGSGTDVGPRATALKSVLPPPGPLRHLLVDHGERSIFLPVERIDWVESDRNYVQLVAAGHRFTLRTTLQALEARLDAARFLRINRSQIVRLDAVREVHQWSHGDRHLVMQDGTRLVWSRRFRAEDEGRFGLG
jgi:two-component system LytT family response regulator